MGHKVKVTPKKAAAYRQQANATPLEGPGKLPLTDRTAQEEAERRWGESGRAWHPAYTRRGEHFYCAVGGAIGETREDWQVFGRGATFEQAFAEAAARGH